MINKEHYAKEVKGFCEIAKKLPKDCQPESAIFAPYTFEKYAEAPKRIFFVGIDSAGWINFKEMLEDYNNNNVEHYLEKNTKVVSVQGENQDGTDKHSLDKNSSWRCNHRSRFWPFCQKLYIYIMTGELVNVTDFTKEHYDLLEGAGYGNLSLVEIKKGWLEKIHKCEDRDLVKELHAYVNGMEKFEHLFQAYEHPDLIIVLGQRGYRNDVLEGLEAKKIESNEFADVFKLGKYNSHVIWTYHPSARKNSAFRSEVLQRLGTTARKLLGLVK